MLQFNYKRNLPYITIILSFFVIIALELGNGQFKNDDSVIISDVVDYYTYLPATFIYHDYKLNFLDTYKGPHKFFIWSSQKHNGIRIIKVSMGMTMLYSPFFFIAHFYALHSNYDAGGYSPPYRFSIMFSNFFYTFLGLFFMAKLLLRYFSTKITAWTILCYLFGTNLIYYVYWEPGMSHAYSFSLIILFAYLTVKWYERQSFLNTIFIGFVLGLITLVRPVNAIIGLFFILWDIKNFNDIKERFLMFLRNWSLLLVILFFCILVWVPQFIYWKAVSGSYWYYSYGDERFFFNNPHIIEGLFSYRKGWLFYTPIMLMPLLGLPLLWKEMRSYFYAIIVIFLIFIYVIFSWWCWWYGGSFGMRPMIDISGLFAIPLALVLTRATTYTKFWKNSIIGISIFFVLLNLFYLEKYRHGSIHFDAMSKKSYWSSFYSIQSKGDYWTVLEPYDYDKAKKGIYVIIKPK